MGEDGGREQHSAFREDQCNFLAVDQRCVAFNGRLRWRELSLPPHATMRFRLAVRVCTKRRSLGDGQDKSGARVTRLQSESVAKIQAVVCGEVTGSGAERQHRKAVAHYRRESWQERDGECSIECGFVTDAQNAELTLAGPAQFDVQDTVSCLCEYADDIECARNEIAAGFEQATAFKGSLPI